jgi:hypothetical protein
MGWCRASYPADFGIPSWRTWPNTSSDPVVFFRRAGSLIVSLAETASISAFEIASVVQKKIQPAHCNISQNFFCVE